MKTTFQSLLVLTIFILVCVCLTFCSKKETTQNPGIGKLKLSVGISVTEYSAGVKLKATPTDYHVQIFTKADALVKDFPHATDIPEMIELPEGSYYAIATSGTNIASAFESPYFLGNSGEITITQAQTSTINIQCSLSNIMVKINYSDQVKNTYSNYVTTIVTTSDSLAFQKDEARAGYFKSGPLNVKTQLYMKGSLIPVKMLYGAIPDPKPGKHYALQIDATPVNGKASINVAFNDTAKTENISITDNNSQPNSIHFNDLLITEIMYNPLALADAEGEWLEIYNNSSKTINLKGLVIRRNTTTSFHQIATDVMLSVNSFAVLGRTITATNNVRYVYGPSISLSNTGDDIVIGTYGTSGLDGTTICSVNYGATGFITNLNGKSLQLNPSIKDATAAMIGTNWCTSTLIYSTGDYGTPGIVNTICQ